MWRGEVDGDLVVFGPGDDVERFRTSALRPSANDRDSGPWPNLGWMQEEIISPRAVRYMWHFKGQAPDDRVRRASRAFPTLSMTLIVCEADLEMCLERRVYQRGRQVLSENVDWCTAAINEDRDELDTINRIIPTWLAAAVASPLDTLNRQDAAIDSAPRN